MADRWTRHDIAEKNHSITRAITSHRVGCRASAIGGHHDRGKARFFVAASLQAGRPVRWRDPSAEQILVPALDSGGRVDSDFLEEKRPGREVRLPDDRMVPARNSTAGGDSPRGIRDSRNRNRGYLGIRLFAWRLLDLDAIGHERLELALNVVFGRCVVCDHAKGQPGVRDEGLDFSRAGSNTGPAFCRFVRGALAGTDLDRRMAVHHHRQIRSSLRGRAGRGNVTMGRPSARFQPAIGDLGVGGGLAGRPPFEPTRIGLIGWPRMLNKASGNSSSASEPVP